MSNSHTNQPQNTSINQNHHKKIHYDVQSLQESISKQSQDIENFIAIHKKMHCHSNSFQNLESLFSLYQTQVSMTYSIRKLLENEQQNVESLNKSLHESNLAISSFLEFLSKYFSQPISTLPLAIEILSNYFSHEVIPNSNTTHQASDYSLYKNQIHHLQQSLKLQQSQNQQLQNQYDILSDKLLKAQQKLAKVKREKIKNSEQISSFQKIEKQYKILLEQFNITKQQLYEAQNSNNTNSQYQKLEQQYENILNSLNKSKNNVNDNQFSNEQKLQYQQLQSDNIDLQNKLSTLQQSSIYQVQYQELLEQYKLLQEENRHLKNQTNQESFLPESLSFTDTHLFQENQQLRAHIQNMEKEMKQLEKENSILQSTIESIQRGKKQSPIKIQNQRSFQSDLPCKCYCDYDSSDSITYFPFLNAELDCKSNALISQTSTDKKAILYPQKNESIPSTNLQLKSEIAQLKNEIKKCNLP